MDHLRDDLEVHVLTVVGEICVKILGGPKAIPDLLQLARLGLVPLENVLGHSTLTIFKSNYFNIDCLA